MHHWQFLTEKLGKDLVNYCILPFLLPAASGIGSPKARFDYLIKDVDHYLQLKLKLERIYPRCIGFKRKRETLIQFLRAYGQFGLNKNAFNGVNNNCIL